MKRIAGRYGASSLVATILSLACGACHVRYWVCDEPDEQALQGIARTLSETGLFADVRSGTLGPGVLAFRPRFALWSDGAEKRRWIAIPPGQRIDTSDMDAWIFPRGTRFWKEFTRDGVRVETRLLEKIGDGEGDWIGMAYVWSSDQTEAYATPWGAVDALGTPHDVPAASECMACHGGRRSRILGFSALQLAHPAPPGEVALDDIAAAGLLTAPPPNDLRVPGNDVEQAALGYLHANCGNCHNQVRPETHGARCFEPRNDLDFWLRVDRLGSPEDTPTYQTAVGSVIEAGNPGSSALVHFVSDRGFGSQMPPLATERVDDGAVALLRAWIEGM
jgi:hypothetical protein